MNEDGQRTGEDLVLLAEAIASDSFDPKGDMNRDGVLDNQDVDMLKAEVCESHGGRITGQGTCCVTVNDLTCCDSGLDGDFESCLVGKNCSTNKDCDGLGCVAICNTQGKCQCQRMCDTDEQCQVLNCPAECTPTHQCACKTPCAVDADCDSMNNCERSVCLGSFCECKDTEGTCLEAGEVFLDSNNLARCCQGLMPVQNRNYASGKCEPTDVQSFSCVACGNSVCDESQGENPCTCPDDCKQCIPDEKQTVLCPDGSKVEWCSCLTDRSWKCIDDPMSQCLGSSCREPGEVFQDFDGSIPCCPPYVKARECLPVVNPDGGVTCDCQHGPLFRCVACDDGECSPGENHCTCPGDCLPPMCTPGDSQDFACPGSNLLVPMCTCDASGTWNCFPDYESQCQGDCFTLGVHFAGEGQCCEGLLAGPDCQVSLNVDGSASCLCPESPSFVCIVCGDGACGPGENHCNCAGDCPPPVCNPGDTRECQCNLVSNPPCYRCDPQGQWTTVSHYEDPCRCTEADASCAQGFVCDPEGTGHCLEDCRLQASDCPDGEVCDPQTGLCHGLLPLDCPSNCDNWALGGDWVVEVNSCYGITDNDQVHVAQNQCTVAWTDPLAAVLGATGCIGPDGGVITEKGCSGIPIAFAAPRYRFTCPDVSGNQTCVFEMLKTTP